VSGQQQIPRLDGRSSSPSRSSTQSGKRSPRSSHLHPVRPPTHSHTPCNMLISRLCIHAMFPSKHVMPLVRPRLQSKGHPRNNCGESRGSVGRMGRIGERRSMLAASRNRECMPACADGRCTVAALRSDQRWGE